MALSASVPAHDLGAHLTIKPLQSCALWVGTRAQLENLGFIPPDTAWPQGKKRTRFDTTSNWFCLYLRSAPSASCAEAVYKIHQYSTRPVHWRNRQIEVKVQELHAVARVGSSAWHAELKRYWQARDDKPFQAFKRALLGQKQRGRKPNTLITLTQGASA